MSAAGAAPLLTRGEGCVVEGVEPGPGGHAVVVVPHHPHQALHIGPHQLADHGLLLRPGGQPKLVLRTGGEGAGVEVRWGGAWGVGVGCVAG